MQVKGPKEHNDDSPQEKLWPAWAVSFGRFVTSLFGGKLEKSEQKVHNQIKELGSTLRSQVKSFHAVRVDLVDHVASLAQSVTAAVRNGFVCATSAVSMGSERIKNVFLQTSKHVPIDQSAPNILTQKWVVDKETCLIEEATRIETIPKLVENAQAQQKYLKSIGKQDFHIEAIVSKSQDPKQNWVNSDSFRDNLRGVAEIRQDSEIIGKVDVWQKQMKASYYTQPAPVNMRYHTCGVENDDSSTRGWLRLGVVSDKSNAFINYEQLKKLADAMEGKVADDPIQIRNTMAQDVITAWKQARVQGNLAVDASAGYALRPLGFSDTQITAIWKALKNNEESRFLAPSAAEKLKVKEAILEAQSQRQVILQQQFLQMVQAHVEQCASPVKGPFNMAHVGLLNPETKVIDDSGWYHNEENEMRDMAAIFDQFDGKKIIFGSKGSYIDDEGNIHLANCLAGSDKEVQLRAIFMNQSVQGHTKNDGAQKELNDKALAQLSSMTGMKTPREVLSQILGTTESTYSSAVDLLDLFGEMKFFVSTGCESAKDRTGFVSALHSIMRIGKRAGIKTSTLQKFMRDQFGEDSIGVRIVKENTGTRIMKVAPLLLEGVTNSLSGLAFRIAMYAKQVFEIIQERKRIAKKLAAEQPPDMNENGIDSRP